MTGIESRIRTVILEEIQQNRKRLGIAESEITPDTNVVHHGLVDSLGFLELVTKLEEAFHVQLDFADEDPNDFMTVRGLTRCVRNARGSQ